MAHKGNREFTGEEISNLTIGQAGFDILVGTGEITAASKDISYWIALKAVDGSVACKAKTFTGVGGDDLATDGNYSTGSNITIEDGDIIYGAFEAVTGSSSQYLIAYRGR